MKTKNEKLLGWFKKSFCLIQVMIFTVIFIYCGYKLYSFINPATVISILLSLFGAMFLGAIIGGMITNAISCFLYPVFLISFSICNKTNGGEIKDIKKQLLVGILEPLDEEKNEKSSHSNTVTMITNASVNSFLRK